MVGIPKLSTHHLNKNWQHHWKEDDRGNWMHTFFDFLVRVWLWLACSTEMARNPSKVNFQLVFSQRIWIRPGFFSSFKQIYTMGTWSAGADVSNLLWKISLGFSVICKVFECQKNNKKQRKVGWFQVKKIEDIHISNIRHKFQKVVTGQNKYSSMANVVHSHNKTWFFFCQKKTR